MLYSPSACHIACHIACVIYHNYNKYIACYIAPLVFNLRRIHHCKNCYIAEGVIKHPLLASEIAVFSKTASENCTPGENMLYNIVYIIVLNTCDIAFYIACYITP